MSDPTPWSRRTAAVLLAASLTGCFSLLDATADFGPRPYGGVRLWFGDGGTGYQAMAWITVIGPLLDIPLCAVFDTLALPVTLARQVQRDRREQSPQPRYRLNRGRTGPSSQAPRSSAAGVVPEPATPKPSPSSPRPRGDQPAAPPRLQLDAGPSDGG